MSEEVINIKLGIDLATNIVTTTAQFGNPNLSVIAPFIASDLIYESAIKRYVDNNFGGSEGITDEFTRDTLFKTMTAGGIIWITNLFTAGSAGLLDGVLNAGVSYTASNGVQTLLDIE